MNKFSRELVVMELVESQLSKATYTVGTLLISVAVGALAATSTTQPILLIGVASVLGLVLALLYRPAIALYVFLFFWPIYPIVNTMLMGSLFSWALRLWQEAVLLLAALGIVLRLAVIKSRALRLKSLDWAVLALLSMSLYGSLLSLDLDLILYGFHLSYTPILMYFLVRLLPLKARDIKRWVKLLLVIGFLIAVIGILIHFTDPASYYLQVARLETLHSVARLGRWRMTSILANPLYFGVLMALGGILSLAYFARGRPKWYWLMGFAAFTACAWLSITRGAWFMLAAGATVVLWGYLRRRRSRMIWILLIGMLIVVLAAMAALGAFQTELRYYLSDSFGNFLLESRYDQWERTWDAISEEPWGHGLGVGHAMLRAGSKESVAINDGWYLKVFAEGGVLGIVVFVVFMISTVTFLVLRMAKAKDEVSYWLYVGVLASFVGFSLVAIVSNVWDYYMVPSVMWMLIGFAVTLTDASTVDSICVWKKQQPKTSAGR